MVVSNQISMMYLTRLAYRNVFLDNSFFLGPFRVSALDDGHTVTLRVMRYLQQLAGSFLYLSRRQKNKNNNNPTVQYETCVIPTVTRVGFHADGPSCFCYCWCFFVGIARKKEAANEQIWKIKGYQTIHQTREQESNDRLAECVWLAICCWPSFD